MICIITITRYPKYFGWAGFFSMALFRLPLSLQKRTRFWKLLGCGKNGAFDIHPDWRQWGVLTVLESYNCTGLDIAAYQSLYGSFIYRWWKLFNCEKFTVILEPLESHGTWDGQEIFGKLPRETAYKGPLAVLTRATIRTNRLKNFWKEVDGVATIVKQSPGFISSIGIGELPWKRQATLSFWQTKEQMKQFAYAMKEHQQVIRKTRQENWYSEDMFVRFKLLESYGSLCGADPLAGKP